MAGLCDSIRQKADLIELPLISRVQRHSVGIDKKSEASVNIGNPVWPRVFDCFYRAAREAQSTSRSARRQPILAPSVPAFDFGRCLTRRCTSITVYI